MLEKIINYISKRRLWFLFVIISALMGFTIGWFVFHKDNNSEVDLHRIHPVNSNFRFINPLLGAELVTKGEFSEYTPLADQMRSFIYDKTNNKKADIVSFYFFDLERGRWVGINENENFNAASLFKVPVMMAYYKKAEYDPQLLSKSIYVVDSASNNTQESDLEPDIIKDGVYTLDELIRDMVIYSDNRAKDVLLTAAEKNFGIDYKNLENAFNDFGVFLDSKKIQYLVSPKMYSLFFRVLYNATFLDRNMSERALNLLSETKFSNGLMAGLPSDLSVAHKFGHYVDEVNKKEELHDCGIIYYPSHPYFLCVMTRGDDINQLKGIIKDISQKVYNSVKDEFGS